MGEVGKIFIVVGLVVALLGAAVWGLAKLGFRGLPGDIRYESESVRLYVPIVTCLVLSVLLTGIVWLWQWIEHK